MGHALVDDGQIVSNVRAVAAADVEAALERLDVPTLPATLRARRVHGTVCFIGMLTNLWTLNEFYPVDCIPHAHADRNRVSGVLVGVVDPADAAVTTKKQAPMKAAWYEQRGPAHGVLVVGEMPLPVPGDGEVRIRLAYSGINPGDVKKRSGWQGSPMPFPRVVPHSDGAGVIDAVGAGVPQARIGQAVWCYGAQSYRAFGTAAEAVVVPDALAVALPDGADAQPELLEQAACLGIAGITGWRAVFAGGPVAGLDVLVWGAASGVGAVALQMAHRGGARVFAVVRRAEHLPAVRAMGAAEAWLADDPALVDQIRRAAPAGVHRIAEVDFAAHIDVDAAVIATGGAISAYYSSADRPGIPYWTLAFADVSLRLLGSDDFPPAVKAEAARELTAALLEGRLRAAIAARLPLDDIARAHEQVERGAGGRVLLSLATAAPARA